MPFDPISLSLMAAGTGISAYQAFKGQKSDNRQEIIDVYAARRMGEINDFANTLATVRQRYMTQLNNFQNYAFQRFMPQAEAQFAGRGLQVSGGAYASELARKSADYQNEGLLTAAQMEREDLGNVESMRQATRNAQMGMAGQVAMNPWSDTQGNFMGQLSGNLMNLGYMGLRNPGMWDTNSVNPIGTQPLNVGYPTNSTTPYSNFYNNRSFGRKIDLGIRPYGTY